MKYYSIIASLLFVFSLTAKDKVNIYLIPGQGADCRLFGKLDIDTSKFELVCLSYSAPPPNADMGSFARSFLHEINTNKKFILIGVSLGGMIATELAHICNPLKTIIISSAKTRYELPVRYRFQQRIPIYKLFPGNVLKKGALILQPIVEPDRDIYKATFIDMLTSKSPEYFKTSIHLIVTWSRESCTESITHIHGNNDHTIPIRNVSNAIVIDEGSHMMTLTKHESISQLINTEIYLCF